MRLIDAEALKIKTQKIKAEALEHGFAPESVCGDILLNFLDNAPTIEAKPVVHAHWEIEYDDDDNIKKCYCSNCGVGCEPMNYCGFCGAQMDVFAGNINVGTKKE